MFTQNTVFIGKGSCSLQTNTTSKPQKIKYNLEKLKEVSKLLFVITSSNKDVVLGQPVIRFLSFSSEKTKFSPALNLLVENFSFLWTNNYVAPYEYWMLHFSFLFIPIAVVVVAVVGGAAVVAAAAVVV